MIYPIQMIREHNLQPADVVVVGRYGGLAAHYLVYMGTDSYGRHWFMANLEQGVSWLDLDYLNSRKGEFFLKRVRPFEGTWQQRQAALRRAESRNGEAYSLTSFNCEHFANYVQYQQESSQQVQVVGAVAGTAAAIGLAWLLGKLFGGSDDDDRRRYV